MSIKNLSRLKKNVFAFDLLALNAAIFFAHSIIFGSASPNISSKVFILLANLSWLIVSVVNKSHRISRPVDIDDLTDKFLMTFIYQSSVLLAAIYFLKILNISRGMVIIALAIFFIAIIIQRAWLTYSIKGSRAAKFFKRKALLLGNRSIANSLIDAFSKHPELNYEGFEFVSEDQSAGGQLEISRLERLVVPDEHELFVCYKEMEIEALDRLVLFGEQNGITINVVYDEVVDNAKTKFWYNNLPILHLNPSSKTGRRIRVFKRLFDILFAGLIMIGGAPVFIVLYALTKMTSKGKAFYKQERIGKNEKPFFIYKFRSMYENAELSGPQLSSEHDPRVTKWGRIIRRTRLDELPQFWNVMKGDMSVVGYRPERKHYIEEITKKAPEYKRMLNHKPGITSLGQVHYGYAENVDQMCERLKYDLLYFRNVNLNSDINIILKTVRVMALAKGK